MCGDIEVTLGEKLLIRVHQNGKVIAQRQGTVIAEWLEPAGRAGSVISAQQPASAIAK